jgi:hypothetical protein
VVLGDGDSPTDRCRAAAAAAAAAAVLVIGSVSAADVHDMTSIEKVESVRYGLNTSCNTSCFFYFCSDKGRERVSMMYDKTPTTPTKISIENDAR